MSVGSFFTEEVRRKEGLMSQLKALVTRGVVYCRELQCYQKTAVFTHKKSILASGVEDVRKLCEALGTAMCEVADVVIPARLLFSPAGSALAARKKDMEALTQVSAGLSPSERHGKHTPTAPNSKRTNENSWI